MTLISHRAEFIFLKTHKTASTSVEVALEPLCAPEDAEAGRHYRPMAISEVGIIGARGRTASEAKWRNHMSALSVRRLIGRDIWRRYAKITTVRNPYDRMVSMFYSRMKPEDREAAIHAPFDRVRADFLTFLRHTGTSNNLNKLTIRTRYVIDHVLYFENLEEEFAELAVSLGLSGTDLPRFKTDRRRRDEPMRDYYTEEARHLVAESAGFELAFFGYSFEKGPNRKGLAGRSTDFLTHAPLHIANLFRTPKKGLIKP